MGLCRTEDVFAQLLSACRIIAVQRAGEGSRAFGIGEQVGVKFANGTNNGGGEFLPGEAVPGKKGPCSVIYVQCFQNIGVAVGNHGEGTAHAVQPAHAAVSAALHPNLFPEVAGAQIFENNRSRAVPGVARVKKVQSLAHVVDLGGQDQGFPVGQIGAQIKVCQSAAPFFICGQGLCQRGCKPFKRAALLCRGCQVEGKAFAVDNETAQPLHILQHGRPVRGGFFRKAAQKVQTAYARAQFFQPARAGKRSPQARCHNQVPGRNKPVFLSGFFLKHHAQKALLIIKTAFGQHFRHKREQLFRFVRCGFSGQDQAGHGLTRVGVGEKERVRIHAAGFSGNGHVQFHKIPPRGAHFQKGATEQGQQGQQIFGKRAQVKGGFRIDNTVCGQGMEQDRGLAVCPGKAIAGNGAVLSWQIRYRQAGDASQGFCAVRRGLPGAQGFSSGPHLFPLGLCHQRGQLFQAHVFFFFLLAGQVLVGP